MAATVVTPAEFVGPLMLLCQERRGEMTEHAALGAGRALLKCACMNLGQRSLRTSTSRSTLILAHHVAH